MIYDYGMKLMNTARIGTIRKWPTVKLMHKCQGNMVSQRAITKQNKKIGKFLEAQLEPWNE